MQQTHEYISLSQAAQATPGRPSINCLWRWSRRGVLARNGQRVKLRHIRIGGKVFTTSIWVEEFCHSLAAADIEYFNLTDPDIPKTFLTAKRPKVRRRIDREKAIVHAEAMLRSAGV